MCPRRLVFCAWFITSTTPREVFGGGTFDICTHMYECILYSMLHYARNFSHHSALLAPWPGGRVRALSAEEAYHCVAVAHRGARAILEGSICGPSFRLLTALEELHPPAGTAYLCRENFRVVREHKLLEKPQKALRRASPSSMSQEQSESAPSGGDPGLCRVCQWQNFLSGDVSCQDWQLVPFPIKNRTTSALTRRQASDSHHTKRDPGFFTRILRRAQLFAELIYGLKCY